MAVLGEDFSGGVFRQGFKGYTPAGLGISLMMFAGLLIGYLLMQGLLAVIVQVLILQSPPGDRSTLPLAAIIGLMPMAIIMVPVAWKAAKLRGGDPAEVLNLRWPRFTLFGWVVVILGFMVGVLVLFTVFITVASQIGFTPPEGGLVENTVSDIASNSAVLALVVPSLIIGAPVAEELLFRGQIFTVLAQTRAGFSGATILTSAGWAMLHFSGNIMQVVLIFLMGLLLGWLLYRFGSILLTIACHAGWNAFVSSSIIGLAGAGS